MKNLHLIPTDKPSFGKYLVINKKGKLCIWSTDTIGSQITLNPQHIYITSDEKIKEGDWFMSDFNSFPIHNIKDLSEREGSLGWKQKDLKNNLKIILTTDQDLDGVQSIDDDFLEWFVKNPSCESVMTYPVISHTKLGVNEYKIVIPKEEPNPFELPKALPDNVFYESLEPKQETIEEASEKCRVFYLQNNMSINQIFEAGVKWQAEQDKNKYSEEQVLKLVDGAFHMYASSKRHDAKEWLVEQFKKK